MINKNKLIGEGINTSYKRTTEDWIYLIDQSLDELENIILDEEIIMNKEDNKYILDNIIFIKRFYEELERELYRDELSNRNINNTIIKSNISLRF